MKPPYEITNRILELIASISEKIGEIKAGHIDKPTPLLRKQNKVKTIHSSLKIEGNTLTEEQITALVENKKVIGPRKDILEVLNAIKVYEKIGELNPFSEKSFLAAHKLLMNGLLDSPGRYRNRGVGIVQGSKIAHLAPPPENVSYLMKKLFEYLKNENELILIKSCVFHYEMEFIHPFTDGNGRMGRLWQTAILMKKYPVFEFLSFEEWIGKTQDTYYNALSKSDKSGESTAFIEYMLHVIDQSIHDVLDFNNYTMNAKERLNYFRQTGIETFTRKDYMNTFKNISSATASRDLKKGIELHIFEKMGTKNKTLYKIK